MKLQDASVFLPIRCRIEERIYLYSFRTTSGNGSVSSIIGGSRWFPLSAGAIDDDEECGLEEDM